MPLRVIHIGKCGGASTISILTKNKIEHIPIHVIKPVYNEKHKYLIVIRNPICRFISAFNWRYKLIVLDKTQKSKRIGEMETLTKYNCVNNLAENIADFGVNKPNIGHIVQDIDFYLGDFLQVCKKENIIGVVTQENLNDDINQIFNICNNNTRINKNNTKTDKYLSDLGYDLLKKHLHKDYECIDKLFAMGCLSQKQYDILSK